MDQRSRRDFLRGSLALAGLSLLSGCGVSPPAIQHPARSAKQARIGVLAPVSLDPSPEGTALRQGLAAAGYVEGDNLVVHRRFSNVKEALTVAAKELLDLGVDLLIAVENQTIYAAREATATTPIVMAVSRNPVESGFVTSLAQPGGNVTGLSSLATVLTGKRLELLRAAIPGVSRVAALLNPEDPASAMDWQATQAAAGPLALELQPIEVRTPSDTPAAFEAAVKEHAQALIALIEPYSFTCGCDPQGIVAFAARHRLPAMYETSSFAEVGGLLSYGPNRPDMFRRVGSYVDKILRGANPAGLPVEQPTTLDFVINLKTARALGLTIPQLVLQQATEIIQ